MAVSTIENGILVIYGLSTDDKDSALEANEAFGFNVAEFVAVDTGKHYLLDDTTGEWYEQAEGGGSGSSLPDVTSSDNGDVLMVVNGAWAKADPPSGLPAVTSSDNGKVLTVSSGAWAAVSPAAVSSNVQIAADSALYGFLLSELTTAIATAAARNGAFTHYEASSSDSSVVTDCTYLKASIFNAKGVAYVVLGNERARFLIIERGLSSADSLVFSIIVAGITNSVPYQLNCVLTLSSEVKAIFYGFAYTPQ